jgi:hypothetical protein
LRCIQKYNFAALTIAITSKKYYPSTEAYSPFFSLHSSENHAFLINTACDKSAFKPETHYLSTFDSGGTWKLYKKTDRESIIVSGGRTFLFDETDRIGTILIEKSEDSIATIRGLLFPFDELLYVKLLTKYSGIIAHACGIIDNGKGAVFVGASGNGKSTMAKVWMNEPNCTILNDDRIIIREVDKGFYAYGTPWHGEVSVCNQGKVTLERLFFLQHADKNYARRIFPADAVSRLIVRSFPAIWDQEGMNANLAFMARLTEEVPCYELGFVPDKSIITFLREFTGE